MHVQKYRVGDTLVWEQQARLGLTVSGKRIFKKKLLFLRHTIMISLMFYQELRAKLEATNCSLPFLGRNYRLTFCIKALISDMPATAAMLNMHHHRALFGCILCYAESELKENIRYFPNKKSNMRDQETHRQNVDEAIRTKKPCKGVKGYTYLSDILRGLPLTAPVDSLHQIYLGVTKVILRVVVAKTAKVDMKDLDEMAKSIKVCASSVYVVFFLN